MPRKLFLIPLLVVALSACVMLPRVTIHQAEWAAYRWPGMDAPKLEMARTLYVNRCSGCHNLKLPSERSVDEWEVVLSSMAPKAKLNAEQKEEIWRYILTAKAVPN